MSIFYNEKPRHAMSLFLKHNNNASVRLSWSHSSTHLPFQSALTSLSTYSGLSKHFLLLRTASLEFGLDFLPNRLLAIPLLQWHVKPPLRALWPECLQTTAGGRRHPRATAVPQPAPPSSRCRSAGPSDQSQQAF